MPPEPTVAVTCDPYPIPIAAAIGDPTAGILPPSTVNLVVPAGVPNSVKNDPDVPLDNKFSVGVPIDAPV